MTSSARARSRSSPARPKWSGWMWVMRIRLMRSTGSFISSSFRFSVSRDSRVCRPVSIRVKPSPSRSRYTFTCRSSKGIGSSSLKIPGATSTGGKLLRGGLGEFFGARGERLLPLVFGRQRQVHRIVGDQVEEGVDHPRIEVAPAAALDLFQRFAQSQRWAIDAVCHHRLEGIGDRDDAGAERDLFRLEALRITRPVPFFVVMPDEGGNVVQAFHRADDIGAD